MNRPINYRDPYREMDRVEAKIEELRAGIAAHKPVAGQGSEVDSLRRMLASNLARHAELKAILEMPVGNSIGLDG